MVKNTLTDDLNSQKRLLRDLIEKFKENGIEKPALDIIENELDRVEKALGLR